MMFSDQDGEFIVRAARAIAESETKGNTAIIEFPDGFDKHCGVFVTFSEYPSGDLRGCIGIPEPVYSLKDAISRSSRSACHDPRFPPLTFKEASECTVEVTLLTPPEELKFNSTEDMLAQIVLGRDGVILEYKCHRALFLPQVAIEWNWTKEEMFWNLSEKAGLDGSAWKNNGVRIWVFRGEIFSEVGPNGKIIRK